MWHRPNIVGTETDLAGIKSTLQIMKNNNINMVFVETFWGGMSMFKSDYVEYNKNFSSYAYGDYPDYLSAFIGEADKLGIEVHAWVEDFFVGLTNDIKILKDHPDWVLYNDDETIYQRKEGGKYVFIDPANPEVQQFLLNYYTELVTKFPKLKGVNLDYIRYPVSSTDLDTGYTAYAMKEFAASLGKTLSDTTDLSKLVKSFKKLFNVAYNLDYKQNLEKWNEYRQNKVTAFVKSLSDNLRKVRSGVIISTAVFASITEAKEQKMQDWASWIRLGYIDIATPMAYYDSAVQVSTKVSDMINITGDKCYNYAGIAPSYRGFAAYENANHALGAFSGGSTGYVIFASQNFLPDEDVQAYLLSGINSKSAVTPNSDLKTVLQREFDDILDKADRIYIVKNAMTTARKTALKAKLDAILAMPYGTASEIEAIYDSIDNLYNYDGLADYASGYAKARITEDLKYINGIVDTHAQRIKLLGNEENPGESDSDSVSESKNESVVSESESKKTGCADSMENTLPIAVILAFLALTVIAFKKKVNKV